MLIVALLRRLLVLTLIGSLLWMLLMLRVRRVVARAVRRLLPMLRRLLRLVRRQVSPLRAAATSRRGKSPIENPDADVFVSGGDAERRTAAGF
jgi:hypothetical protein